MYYEWDDRKQFSNIDKHGIDFECIERADWQVAIVARDTRKDYGEVRLQAYLPIDGRLHAVIYVKRSDRRRIISLRKANDKEVDLYEKARKIIK